MKMMQVLILLLLPLPAVGWGYEVCYGENHQAHTPVGWADCCCHGAVGDCCHNQGKHHRHGHHHERIRLMLDAGLRDGKDGLLPPVVTGHAEQVAELYRFCFHSGRTEPLSVACGLLPLTRTCLPPMRC